MTHHIPGILNKIKYDFSLEIMVTRRKWDDIFKVMKEKRNCQLRIICSEKLAFKNQGKVKTVPDKQRLREFVTSIPTLQEILKKVI